jgi:hypothetical protein
MPSQTHSAGGLWHCGHASAGAVAALSADEAVGAVI